MIGQKFLWSSTVLGFSIREEHHRSAHSVWSQLFSACTPPRRLGTGEGGVVVWTDPDGIDQVTQALNFGFFGTRNSRSPSTNGKMSEYHAAVALASLDGWAKTRQAFLGVADRYRLAAEEAGLSSRLFVPPDVGMTYAIFECASSPQATRVRDELREGGIKSRLWYGAGLQSQTYFADAPRGGLKTTEDVMPRLVGLPMAADLSDAEILRIVARIASAVKGSN